MQFPQILQNLMSERGYSNYRLAQLLDISQSTVAYWLDGKGVPQRSKRKQLAGLFDVTVEYLMGEQTETPATSEGDRGNEASAMREEVNALFDSLDSADRARLLAFAQGLKLSQRPPEEGTR